MRNKMSKLNYIKHASKLTTPDMNDAPMLAEKLPIFRDLACGTIFMFNSFLHKSTELTLIKVGEDRAYALKTKKNYNKATVCVAQLIKEIDPNEHVIVPGVEII